MSIEKLQTLLQPIEWLRPALYGITEQNIQEHLSTICLCLAVDQKYFPVFKAIKPYLVQYFPQGNRSILVAKLTVHSTYLDFKTASALLDGIEFDKFLIQLLHESPSLQKLNEFLSYCGADMLPLLSHSTKLLKAVLTSQNEELILAFWNEACQTRFPCNSECLDLLSKTGNARLIGHISSNMASEFTSSFHFALLSRFAISNNVELFKQFSRSENFDPFFLQNAVLHGSLEVVEYCLQLQPTTEITEKLIVFACLSGNMTLVNLLKSRGQVDWTVAIAIQYANQLFMTNYMKIHNDVLNILLPFLKNTTLYVTVKKLVMCCVGSTKDIGADEETFRILASHHTTLNLGCVANIKAQKRLLPLCLKHFKNTPVPNNVFTHEELISLLQRGELEPSQMFPMPTCKPPEPITKVLLDFVNIKRTVYLYFASETKLRDIVEIVLEYM